MTRKIMLIAGAATMALSVPAMAGPKDGRGGGHSAQAQERGGGKGFQRNVERGGGKQKAARAERGGEARARADRQRTQRSVRVERPRAERKARVERQRIERSPRIERQQRIAQGRERMKREERSIRVERPRIERQARIDRRDRVRAEQTRDIRRLAGDVDRRGFRVRDVERRRYDDRDYDGFKNFGQAVAARAHFRNELRKEAKREWKIGQRFDRDWAARTNWMPLRYSSRYYDTPDWTYRYDGDRVYRVSRDTGLIGGIIPLLGGAYSVGQPLPGYYSSSYVPLGYRNMYYDTPDHYYRYGDGGLYQVNSDTGLITSLVALLTGTNLGIGSMLPASYNTYNVPFAYRDRYYDTNDAWYRYNNGYIYQVDPYSRMVEASYPLYGNGYYDVGQPWPSAYPSYNVPYPYQSTYYDTPEWDYRYANGAIYQVNPETQLVNALVSLVTGQPLTTGQMMPSGYGVYNVPMQYRSQYYDTADSWYRYGDGNIYQVDPYSGRIADVIPIYA